jgi:hypothetical protein
MVIRMSTAVRGKIYTSITTTTYDITLSQLLQFDIVTTALGAL